MGKFVILNKIGCDIMTKKNIGLKYEDLKEKVSHYMSDARERTLIDESYQYASQKHLGQRRLTGEEYIEHPLNVAYILAEIEADAPTICAALLHDVVEDCNVTNEEMILKFGPEIANLVDGVTKINKLNFNGDTEAMIANHRKILVGMSEK